MGDSKQSAEESFRASLEDVITIVQKLSTVCTSFDDLIGMCKLALENDGQTKLLLRLVSAK